ncbi:hypothetical protein WJX81_005060 [Elliptochloris bilobata]|uniref:Uncharacterized protein n=1 Tax=Elliptochloris bilobata TaxID=381761 RepID=A0AAW1RWK6_9CHLO
MSLAAQQPGQPGPGDAARPPRRAPAPPRYDPIFNPIIAITTNESAAMGSVANTAATGGVQTVSANTAQSLQAPVNNPAAFEQPATSGGAVAGGGTAAGSGGQTVTVTNGFAQLPAGVAPASGPGAAGGAAAGVGGAALPPQVASVFSSAERAKNMPLVSAANGGFSIQQPIVSNSYNGITSGGNVFKAGQQGVTLGNVGVGDSIQFAQGGGVTIDPGSAGSLWNLARQAASLYGRYGRKLKLWRERRGALARGAHGQQVA